MNKHISTGRGRTSLLPGPATPRAELYRSLFKLDRLPTRFELDGVESFAKRDCACSVCGETIGEGERVRGIRETREVAHWACATDERRPW
jgi:hypothetical protein